MLHLHNISPVSKSYSSVGCGLANSPHSLFKEVIMSSPFSANKNFEINVIPFNTFAIPVSFFAIPPLSNMSYTLSSSFFCFI